jgi:hypothetical protein
MYLLRRDSGSNIRTQTEVVVVTSFRAELANSVDTVYQRTTVLYCSTKYVATYAGTRNKRWPFPLVFVRSTFTFNAFVFILVNGHAF